MRERWSDSYCVRIFRPLSPCKYPPYFPHIINAKKITFDGGETLRPFCPFAFLFLLPLFARSPPCFSRQSFAPFLLFDFAPLSFPPFLSLSFPVHPFPVCALYSAYTRIQKKRGFTKSKVFYISLIYNPQTPKKT